MIETKTLKRSSTNSDIKMEVNAISDYLKPNMPLPQYLPYARFLLDTDLSHTAKLLYTLLLDRATLSQKNNWMDAQGRIYVIYPLSHLAKDLGCCISSVPQPKAADRHHQPDAGRDTTPTKYCSCPHL